VIDHGVEFLLKSQSTNGGWGYASGQAECVEPTAAAILALSGEAATEEPIALAARWLLKAQNKDGGWGFTAGDRESGWATAWALLALGPGDENQAVAEQARNWLRAAPTYQAQTDKMQAEFQRLGSIDMTLRGWPWLPDQASWVEPTALAILALSARPGEPRVTEAIKYLGDRRCQGGGWNFGNPVMLGAPLPPRAIPTALVLLALSVASPYSIKDEDVQSLRSDMHQDGGALSLGWGLLALRRLGEEDAEGTRLLADLQAPNGGWNENPYHTAIAILSQKDLPWLKK
jgi:hypothetical protein